MKGAFEYACKIWEEAMPTTFPIKIKAVLDENSITGSLSKIWQSPPASAKLS